MLLLHKNNVLAFMRILGLYKDSKLTIWHWILYCTHIYVVFMCEGMCVGTQYVVRAQKSKLDDFLHVLFFSAAEPPDEQYSLSIQFFF